MTNARISTKRINEGKEALKLLDAIPAGDASHDVQTVKFHTIKDVPCATVVAAVEKNGRSVLVEKTVFGIEMPKGYALVQSEAEKGAWLLTDPKEIRRLAGSEWVDKAGQAIHEQRVDQLLDKINALEKNQHAPGNSGIINESASFFEKNREALVSSAAVAAVVGLAYWLTRRSHQSKLDEQRARAANSPDLFTKS